MQKGDFIRIGYVARLESGEIFDLTDGELAKKENIFNPKISYRPIPIIVGAGFVIPGLDKALLEMNVGDKRAIEVLPEDGFGNRDPKLVRVVPRKVFSDNRMEPQQGMIVDFSGMKGRIQSVSGGRVRVDFNNPLAGKKLVYELEVKERVDEPEKMIRMVLEFFGIEKAEVKLGEAAEIETSKLPVEVKEKISSLVIEHIKPEGKPIGKVKFIETYETKKG